MAIVSYVHSRQLMQHHDPQPGLDPSATASSLICHRCGAILHSGRGEYYIVRIDAIADPSPPAIDNDEPVESIAADYELLIAQMNDMSEQELLDQVHRRLILHLCTRCYTKWIEDPTG